MGVWKEGEIEIDILMDMILDKGRLVKVLIYFGGLIMEIKVEVVNFLVVVLFIMEIRELEIVNFLVLVGVFWSLVFLVVVGFCN